MHAIYIRGAILRLGSRSLQARAYLSRWPGAVGGWSSSVQQHVRWRQAPLARACADADRRGRDRSPGRSRATSASTSATAPSATSACSTSTPSRPPGSAATACWSWPPKCPTCPPALVDDFRRVRDDEDRHARIFAHPGRGARRRGPARAGRDARGRWPRRIGEVGEYFLPRALRRRRPRHPLGAGGRVWVVAGADARGEAAALPPPAGRRGPGRRLRERDAGPGQAVRRVAGGHQADLHARLPPQGSLDLTDPELLDELADCLHELGLRRRGGGRGAATSTTASTATAAVAEVARYFGIRVARLPAGRPVRGAGAARLSPRPGAGHGRPDLEGGRLPHLLRQDAQPPGRAWPT